MASKHTQTCNLIDGREVDVEYYLQRAEQDVGIMNDYAEIHDVLIDGKSIVADLGDADIEALEESLSEGHDYHDDGPDYDDDRSWADD